MKFLWIFDHDAIWVLVPMSSALFALGGSGFKEFRRLGIPALMLAAAVSLGVEWWKALVSAAGLALVLTKGYGDDLRSQIGAWYHPALYVLAALYGAAALPVSLDWKVLIVCPLIPSLALPVFSDWKALIVCPLIPSLIFGTLTLGSQRFDFPKWKIVEMAAGAAIGFSFVYALGGVS